MRETISSPGAPSALGAYSPAIRAGNFVFVSGQVPIDPATGALVDGDIRVQTDRVMRNIAALLAAAGTSFAHVVRATVYLVDMNEFSGMNEAYTRHLVGPPPARSTVEVSRLPRDVKVEIDVIAITD